MKDMSAFPLSIVIRSLARSTRESGGDLNKETSSIEITEFTSSISSRLSLKDLRCSSCSALIMLSCAV